MSGLPQAVARYLGRRGVQGPWALHGARRQDACAAIVIPALAEGDSLFATLDSLTTGSAVELQRTLVVVVVNQGAQADPTVVECNRQDLLRLGDYARGSHLSLAWVDACSPGLELPAEQAGAGLARKLGMDLALPCLDWARVPLLVSLDADTLVEENYLQVLFAHFQRHGGGAATLPFHHQPAGDAEGQAAIDRYELFLRSHLLGLGRAGSPYAFPTIGSAFACRAASYVRSGGMSRRKAGEDFYFLQQVAKTDGVAAVAGTRVYPSARCSQRVPFGTGPSVARQLAGEPGTVAHYATGCYRLLACWLQTVTGSPHSSAAQLLAEAEGCAAPLGEFLEQSGWLEVWPRLCANHTAVAPRLQAFHRWFDGLKTLRMIHAVSAAAYPRQPAEQALPELLAWCDLPCPQGVPEQLALLRRRQECGWGGTKST